MNKLCLTDNEAPGSTDTTVEFSNASEIAIESRPGRDRLLLRLRTTHAYLLLIPTRRKRIGHRQECP